MKLEWKELDKTDIIKDEEEEISEMELVNTSKEPMISLVEMKIRLL